MATIFGSGNRKDPWMKKCSEWIEHILTDFIKAGTNISITEDTTNHQLTINSTGGSSVEELNDLDDVNITNPSNGQAMIYDSANDLWKNANLPTPAEQVQSDWNQSDSTKKDYIKNKPTIPDELADLSDDSTHRLVTDTQINQWNAAEANVQSDWNQSTTTADDFIKNKPTLGTAAAKNVGVANGVAELDSDGKVPSSQLPSYVDDVLEYSSISAFPATGESGKIYVALDTNKTYRWSGTNYVEISASLALGETSSTAYRGDRGKTAYNHATETGRAGATQSGLYKVASTAEGHVASLTAVQKSDITALGIPAQDTTYTGTGLISVNASTHVISTTAEANQNAFSKVKVTQGTTSTDVNADSKTDTIEIIAGNNVILTPDATNDKITIGAIDTTYTASGVVSIDANNNITSTAEVNQNTFAKVKVGSTTITADAKQDTLELVAGDNITLTPDATNDKVTINASQPTVNDGTLTITQNGTTVGDFTANQSGDETIDIDVHNGVGTEKNIQPTEDTPAAWKTALGNYSAIAYFVTYYDTANKFANQPYTYGFLETFFHNNIIYQRWSTMPNGAIYYRRGNGTGWNGSASASGTFTQIATTAVATTSANGLMSSTDKTKMDNRLNNIVSLPYVNYSAVGVASNVAIAVFLEAWLVYMATNYESLLKLNKYIVAECAPSARGFITGICYDSAFNDSHYPRYSEFVYHGYNQNYSYRFGTNDYAFSYQEFTSLAQQENTTSNSDYRVLLSGNANDTSGRYFTRKSGNLTFNPSTKTLKAELLDGASTKLTKTETILSTDKVPYVYRKALNPSGFSGYIREMLVGGSVGWNQNIYNGNFVDTSKWVFDSKSTASASNNVLTLTATAAGALLSANTEAAYRKTWQVGHKILATLDAKSSTSGLAIRASLAYETVLKNTIISYATLTSSWQSFTKIVNITEATNGIRIAHSNYTAVAVGDAYQVRNVYAVDLTILFGSVIADYIYNLETATAGSGVSLLRSLGLFTEPYYEQDNGSVQSVCVKEKKIVGFNQWDEEWEVGAIAGTSGVKTAYSNRIRSKNYCKCVPNVSYCARIGFNVQLRLFWYDADKNFISYNGTTNGVVVATSPLNAAYFMVTTEGTTYGEDYRHDICVNISDTSKNGTYEPYHLDTIPLSATELRGIPKLDSNNNIYFDGDEYTSDGKKKRKYGIVNLGTLDWTYYSGNQYFSTTISDKAPLHNIICPLYTVDTSSVASMANMTMKGGTNNNYFYVKNSSYTDAATFKTAMDGVYLVYELAEPTEETALTYQNPQYAKDGTEEFVDGKTRDIAVPVGHVTEYMGATAGEYQAMPTMPVDSGKYVLTADKHEVVWEKKEKPWMKYGSVWTLNSGDTCNLGYIIDDLDKYNEYAFSIAFYGGFDTTSFFVEVSDEKLKYLTDVNPNAKYAQALDNIIAKYLQIYKYGSNNVSLSVIFIGDTPVIPLNCTVKVQLYLR